MTSTGYSNNIGHELSLMEKQRKKKSTGNVNRTLETTVASKKEDRSGSPGLFDNSLNVSSHDRPNLLESQ